VLVLSTKEEFIMAQPICTEDEFIKIWHECGCSPSEVSRRLGCDVRKVYERRNRIEGRRDIKLPTHSLNPAYAAKVVIPQDQVTIKTFMENGVIVVGSDAHYWPGLISAGHKAFVAIIAALKPEMVVLNGDLFDGARISRHDRIGWDKRPTVKEELEAVQDRLEEIEKVAIGAHLIRTVGNHDLRFETRLATMVSDYEGVQGFALKDHLPRWEQCIDVMINEGVQIKHRYHNGVHAVYNNALKSGISMVTGHLHSLKVTPWTDMRGDRYGVDTGTLADPWGPQFDYMEQGSRNWRAGCAILTFRNGELMPPELCQIIGDDEAYFRGQVFKLTGEKK
jgi:hypothetical protein